MRSVYAMVVVFLWGVTAPLQAQGISSAARGTPTLAAAAGPAKPMPFDQDWAQLTRYAAANAGLPPAPPDAPRVIFLGDSITDFWNLGAYPGKQYINRGIGAQTTTQMLVRFQQDVLDLHPAVLVILAGTNDIATQPRGTAAQTVETNISAMAIVARNQGIRVVVSSITPVLHYWDKTIPAVSTIHDVNRWLQDFCDREHFTYLDYYTSMADNLGGMKPGLSGDGLHPTPEGYAVMFPLAESAIEQALRH